MAEFLSTIAAKVAVLFDPKSAIEESKEAYRPGGFHPVRIGETYNGKYEVLRKLGYGQKSTVWLVRNQSDGNFWAMKVLSAEVRGSNGEIVEVEVLKRLRDINPLHPGFEFVTKLEDYFEHEGPNGRHACLIFKALGENLSSFRMKFPNGEISRPLVQNFTHQLLQAISYAHSCGLIHTDIQPENIMLWNPNETALKTYLTKRYSKGAKSASKDGTNQQPVRSDSLQNCYMEAPTGFNLMDLQIVLSDWDTAHWSGTQSLDAIQPIKTLRAPEVILEAPWGPAVDLWNLGALVPELIYSQNMFSGKDWKGYSIKFHLAEMNALLGPFPKTLIDKSRLPEAQKLFNEDGDTVDFRLTNAVPLQTRFKDLPPDELPLFEDFIMFLLELDPEYRKSAEEMLDHPWLHYAYTEGVRVRRVSQIEILE